MEDETLPGQKGVRSQIVLAAPELSGDDRRGKKRVPPFRSSLDQRKRIKDGSEELVNMTLDRRYGPEGEANETISISTMGHPVEELRIHGISKNTVGHLIMPCHAKGMPSDHNEKTAYFIIGSDIKHGHELICTHLGCQKEGLKFKYCSFCQAPVPKLNFSTRHDHSSRKSEASDESQGGTTSRDQAGIPYQVTTQQQASSGGTDESTTNSSERPAKNTVSKKVSESSSNIESAHASTETQTSASGETNSLRLMGNSSTSSVQSSRFSNETGGAAALPPPPTAAEAANVERSMRDLEALGTVRRYEWARLLGQRPRTDNRDTISSWLLEVLSISDLNAPLKITDSSSPTTDASNDSSSETRGTNNGSMDSSGPTDQSGTAGTSRTDGSSANDSSSDTRETNNQSTTDSNDSANDSASDTQEPTNNIV